MNKPLNFAIKTLFSLMVSVVLIGGTALAQTADDQINDNSQPAGGAAGPLVAPVRGGEEGTVSLILVFTNKKTDRMLGNVSLTISGSAYKGPTPDPPPSQGYIIGGIKEGETDFVAERVGYKIYHKAINVKSEAGYMNLNIELEPLPGTPEVSRTGSNQSNYWNNWGSGQLPNNYNSYSQSWNQGYWNNSVLNPYYPSQQTYQQNYNSNNYTQPYWGNSSQYNPQYNSSYSWPNSSYQQQSYQYPQEWYPSALSSQTAPARIIVGNRNLATTGSTTVNVQVTNQATHQVEFSKTLSPTEVIQSQYPTGISNSLGASLCLTSNTNFTITVAATISGEQKTASNVFSTRDNQTLTTVYVIADIREGTNTQLSPFEIIARTSQISSDTPRCGNQNYYPYSGSYGPMTFSDPSINTSQLGDFQIARDNYTGNFYIVFGGNSFDRRQLYFVDNGSGSGGLVFFSGSPDQTYSSYGIASQGNWYVTLFQRGQLGTPTFPTQNFSRVSFSPYEYSRIINGYITSNFYNQSALDYGFNNLGTNLLGG